LEDLRLIYQDNYPDIVQMKAQIQMIKREIESEISSRIIDSSKMNKQTLLDSPMAMEIRSQILKSKTDISTLQSKKSQLNRFLEKERQKVNRINSVEAEISELTRDYQVNQVKYNELIEQRENARISMNIDAVNQSSSTRIEEHASLPVLPEGLRFAHIILAGLVLSIAAPLALVFGLTLLDDKIRDPKVITDTLKLPILASVQPIINSTLKREKWLKILSLTFILILSWSLYGYEIWLHKQG